MKRALLLIGLATLSGCGSKDAAPAKVYSLPGTYVVSPLSSCEPKAPTQIVITSTAMNWTYTGSCAGAVNTTYALSSKTYGSSNVLNLTIPQGTCDLRCGTSCGSPFTTWELLYTFDSSTGILSSEWLCKYQQQ